MQIIKVIQIIQILNRCQPNYEKRNVPFQFCFNAGCFLISCELTF